MKTFKGKVFSTKMAQTAIVEVSRQKIHPIYKKRLTLVKNPVHDLIGVKVGDEVKFKETRPISKTKKWEIMEVIKK
jgi:small subunit ribosomal protein S17